MEKLICNEGQPSLEHRELLKTLAADMSAISDAELARTYDPNFETGSQLKKHQRFVFLAMHIGAIAKKNNWGICRRDGSIYLFNGSFWAAISEDDLQYFITEAAIQMGQSPGDAHHFSFANELLHQFKKYFYIKAPERVPGKILINFKSTTLEISRCGGGRHPEIRECNGNMHILNRCQLAEDFLRYALPFDYDPAAVCPLYDSFMEWAQPEKEARNILDEYPGYCFTVNGDYKTEKVLFNHGIGGNGKSTYRFVMSAIFGKDNVSSHSLAALADRNMYTRALIVNKVLNFAGEIGDGDIEFDIFKTMASGEPMTVRQIYGIPQEVTEYAKLIFNGNRLPPNPEDTDGYYRRILLIRWVSKRTDADKDIYLSDKIIRDELPGMFNRILTGLDRFIKNGGKFTEYAAAKVAVDEYREDSDHVRSFLAEWGFSPGAKGTGHHAADRVDEGTFFSNEDIFGKYCKFCETNRIPEKQRETGITFRKKLEHIGFKKEVWSNTRGFYIKAQSNEPSPF